MFSANANGVNGIDVGGANCIGCNDSSVGLDCASGIARDRHGIYYVTQFDANGWATNSYNCRQGL